MDELNDTPRWNGFDDTDIFHDTELVLTDEDLLMRRTTERQSVPSFEDDHRPLSCSEIGLLDCLHSELH